jgi:hypothetical protein
VSRAASRTAVFALAAVLTVSIAYDLWRTPVQVWDAIEEMIAAQHSPSIVASFESALGTTAYLRPLRIAQIKALFDLSHGHYHAAYRGFHVLLLVALVALFARVLRVESSRDAVAAAFALLVLTGMHTFLGFLREAFPINHFLEIAVFTLVAVNLAASRGGWLIDAAAALTFACAALTLESGILVWVVLAAAWLCGLRGVSTRGVALVTALTAGYFVLRFGYLHTGLPGLDERQTGFLLERLDRGAVLARFGSSPLLFHIYNVVVSALSVLVAEPRDGQFVAAGAWLRGDVHPVTWIAVISSLATTALLTWYGVRAWRRREFGYPERLAVVAVAVILANAALSFSYAKDDIVAVAGVFYAIAAYAAMRAALASVPTVRPLVAVAAGLALVALSAAWAVRSSGVHYVVSTHAFRIRNDWARAPMALQEQGRWPRDAATLALIDRLRANALEAEVPNPLMAPDWKERWYGN